MLPGVATRVQMPLLCQKLAFAAFFAVPWERVLLLASCGHQLLSQARELGHMLEGWEEFSAAQREVISLSSTLLKRRILQTSKEGQMRGGQIECYKFTL